MQQYTETYRIKLSIIQREKLDKLKTEFKILPARFIRLAIEEKLKNDLPKLRVKAKKQLCPF